MILRIILFVLFLLIITTLLFFITCILSPAVSEQTGITRLMLRLEMLIIF